jgi:hypothetical protein
MPSVDIASLKLYTDNNVDSDNDLESEQACNLLLTQVPHSRLYKKRLDKANYRASRKVGASDMLEDGLRIREKRIEYCSTCQCDSTEPRYTSEQ